MATTFEFTLSCERADVSRARTVLDDAHLLMSRLEETLSEFIPESAVSRLNRARAGEEVSAPDSLLELLQVSERLRRETSGAFDCTFRSRDVVPPPGERVRWDSRRGVAWKSDDRVHVAFGAIGKGYALDRACLLIEQAGFENYLLNAGGSSVVISGFYCQGRPWQWGWSWAKDEAGAPLGVRFEHPEGQRIAIGVSGIHEKGRHILDPRVGENPDSLQSALVAQLSCAEADALSTAAFVSGAVPESRDRYPVASIDQRGQATWNRAFQALWGGISAIAAWVLAPTTAFGEESVDLSEMGADAFTPYIFERSIWWVAVPAFALAMILLHLLKNKPAKKQGSQGNEKR